VQDGPEADNLRQQLALLGTFSKERRVAIKKQGTNTRARKRTWTDDQINTCNEAVKLEEDKRKNWRLENVRRKHNYIPFIMNMLKILADKGQLVYVATLPYPTALFSLLLGLIAL
jgi:hypothetical protein